MVVAVVSRWILRILVLDYLALGSPSQRPAGRLLTSCCGDPVLASVGGRRGWVFFIIDEVRWRAERDWRWPDEVGVD